MKKSSILSRSSVRVFWKTAKAGAALFLISLFVLIYGYIALDYEVARGWTGHVSVQNVMKDVSVFIPVAAAFVAMIVGGIDLMMLLSDWYLERQEKRFKAALDAAKAEGEARAYRAMAEWDRRRKEAEARGETFTEPIPGPSQNGSE